MALKCHRGRVPRVLPTLVLVSVFFGLTRLAGATTYYISPGGNDWNNGTSATSPWKTIDKANAVSFKPGDSVLFQGGQTFSGNLTFSSDDGGNASLPVTVASYGTGRATLYAGWGDALRVHDTSGFVISSLNVRGAGLWGGTTGIRIDTDLVGQRSTIRVDQVDVANFYRGILVQGYRDDSQLSGFYDVRITNTAAHDVGGYGIIFWTGAYWGTSNIYLGHCSVYNVPGGAGIAAAGISLQNCQNAVVERSTVHDVGANSDRGPAGFSVLDSNNVTFQYCESYANKKPYGRHDGDGIDLDGGTTNSTIQYCYIHDNLGPGITLTQYWGGLGSCKNNVIRYNVLENNGRSGQSEGGIQIWGAASWYRVDNCQIYNNTVYTGDQPNNYQTGILAMGYHSNIALRNNVFVNKSGTVIAAYDSPGGLICQGNDYWAQNNGFSLYWYNKSYYTLPSWRWATGQERLNGVDTGFNVDPLLNAPGAGGTIGNPDALGGLTAYKLRSGSPLINAGLNLWNQFGVAPGNSDYCGTYAPQSSNYDIGAYEYW